MLFLGLGTGLGTALIANGVVKSMELGHLPYKKGTYEDYVGRAGLERNGKKKWRRHVADVVERLVAALRPDETVIGGGNVNKLGTLPGGVARGKMPTLFAADFACGKAQLPGKCDRTWQPGVIIAADLFRLSDGNLTWTTTRPAGPPSHPHFQSS